jgi:hypothetical protein
VADLGIHIMQEHKGELFLIRPSGPPNWFLARSLIDGPSLFRARSLDGNDPSPYTQLKPSGDDGFEPIE